MLTRQNALSMKSGQNQGWPWQVPPQPPGHPSPQLQQQQQQHGQPYHNNYIQQQQEPNTQNNLCLFIVCLVATVVLLVLIGFVMAAATIGRMLRRVFLAVCFYCSYFLESGPIMSTMTVSEISRDSTGCSALSFLLRDGVCDEVTNVERCLYDGGDCCKPEKNTQLCQDCTCKMTIDGEELLDKYEELDVKMWPVKNYDMNSAMNATFVVEDVVLSEVCSLLCLDEELSEAVNAWTFDKTSSLCSCGMVRNYNNTDNSTQIHTPWCDLDFESPTGHFLDKAIFIIGQRLCD